MNSPKEPAPNSASNSAEAYVGIGMTIAWLGLLGVLLGWAEWLRHETKIAWIWLPIGVIGIVIGVICALIGRGKKS